MSDQIQINEFIPLPSEVAAKLTLADRYLVSYPRSGRTWIVRMLRILPQVTILNDSGRLDDLESITGLWTHEERGNLDEPGPDWINPFTMENPSINFLMVHGWGKLLPFAKGPHLYVFRSPEDVMVSYYHYAKEKRFIDSEVTSLTEFARGNLHWWRAHLQRAIEVRERAEMPRSWQFLSFERVFADPFNHLSRVARHFEIKFSEAALKQVIEVTTPKEMTDLVPGLPVLSSKPGRGAQDLSPEVLAEVEEHDMPLYRKALEIENADCRGE